MWNVSSRIDPCGGPPARELSPPVLVGGTPQAHRNQPINQSCIPDSFQGSPHIPQWDALCLTNAIMKRLVPCSAMREMLIFYWFSICFRWVLVVLYWCLAQMWCHCWFQVWGDPQLRRHEEFVTPKSGVTRDSICDRSFFIRLFHNVTVHQCQ